MTEVPHLGFIVAAYAVTAVVLGGTVLAVLLDARAQRHLLAKLEQRRDVRRPTGPEAGKAE